jgi:hypothetical protein
MATVKRENLKDGSVRETKTFGDGSQKIVHKTEGFIRDKIHSVEIREPRNKK